MHRGLMIPLGAEVTCAGCYFADEYFSWTAQNTYVRKLWVVVLLTGIFAKLILHHANHIRCAYMPDGNWVRKPFSFFPDEKSRLTKEHVTHEKQYQIFAGKF